MFGAIIFMPISFFAKIDATRFVIFTYKEEEYKINNYCFPTINSYSCPTFVKTIYRFKSYY